MTANQRQSGGPEGQGVISPPISGTPKTDYTVLPEGFSFERPAMLDADPDWDSTVATVRGICVEYRHLSIVDGDAEIVTVVPDMGRPSYRTFPSWVEAHDYVCDTARREVLAEIGHACRSGWEYGVAPCERCAVEPCDRFRSIGRGPEGDFERSTFCACGFEYADHAETAR